MIAKAIWCETNSYKIVNINFIKSNIISLEEEYPDFNLFGKNPNSYKVLWKRNVITFRIIIIIILRIIKKKWIPLLHLILDEISKLSFSQEKADDNVLKKGISKIASIWIIIANIIIILLETKTVDLTRTRKNNDKNIIIYMQINIYVIIANELFLHKKIKWKYLK